MAEGGLPNLAKLMKSGVSGPFSRSFRQLLHQRGLQFMTGKSPGKHGVFHFVEAERDGYAMNYASGGSRRSPTVWRLFNNAGFSVINLKEPIQGSQINE